MKHTSRRQFLRGAGGVAVGLPFLPSLLPGPAWAQEMPTPEKRFISITSDHGGVSIDGMHPAMSTLTDTMMAYPGHEVRRGQLAATVEGGQARISDVLRASELDLTDRLVSQMNVFLGLDIPFYIGHHKGGHLGDYSRNDGNGEEGAGIQGFRMPTIDELIAYSDNFYSDLAGVTTRNLAMGDYPDSRTTSYSTPGDPTSPLEPAFVYTRAVEAYRALFPNPQQQSDSEDERPSIIDRVIESYRSLRQSNRRLSSADRQRLESHVARLQELDRRLNTTLSCDLPDSAIGSGAGSLTLENTDAMTEVLILAMLCGTTRIAVYNPLEAAFANFGGDWHNDVAHQHWNPEPQRLLREANQIMFERVVLRIAQALDVEDVPGSTVLENSLISWTNESGPETHSSVSMPVVTFGGAGGQFRTGYFYDYRNMSRSAEVLSDRDQALQSGLLYNQYLANVLMAFDVPESVWASVPYNADTGYGYGLIGGSFAGPLSSGDVIAGASDWLPWLHG